MKIVRVMLIIIDGDFFADVKQFLFNVQKLHGKTVLNLTMGGEIMNGDHTREEDDLLLGGFF